MKRTILNLSILASVLAFMPMACSRIQLEPVVEEKTGDSKAIPVSIALDNLESALKTMSFQTKSQTSPEYSRSDIIVVGKNNRVSTKSAEYDVWIPDTLLYVVNFNGGEGFAVLSGDSRISVPIFCITESGSLQLHEFEQAMDYLHKAQKQGTCANTDMGEQFVPVLILSSALSQLYANKDGGSREGGEGDGGWNGEGDEGGDETNDNDFPTPPELPEQGGIAPSTMPDPLIKTKWTQSLDPFNRYTPNNYPAGCSAIALAQVVLANRHANTMTFNGVTCDWDEMESVCNYLNFQSSFSWSDEGKEQVANFIYGLGAEYLDLEYGEDGGSPSGNLMVGYYIRDAIQALGYSSSLEHSHFFFTETMRQKTSDMLQAGLPVIARGTVVFGQGHVWVIDGYAYLPLLFGNQEFYHINWGWRGRRDGYYNLGVFDTTQGVFSHPVYDYSEYLNQGGCAENYACNFAIIEYSF